MPAAPKSPKYKNEGPGIGVPKQKGAVRAKSGCYTCRIRRKKCDERADEKGRCETCVRLRLQCLGFGAKRPDWLRESRNVTEMRDKIKVFLAAQGLIKGHSGSGPRGADQDAHFLRLDDDNATPSSSESPPTPTLSLSPSSEAPRQLHTESAMREQMWPGVYHDHHGMMRSHSPFGGSANSHTSHHAADMSLYPAQQQYNSSNSLVSPWPSTTRSSAHMQHLASATATSSPTPALISSFGATYHMPVNGYDADELYYSAPVFDDADLPTFSFCPPLRPGGGSDDLVNYYMNKVMALQYLLADSDHIRTIIVPSVTKTGASREAARLLASIHAKRSSIQSTSFAALQDDDTRNRYEELLELLQKSRYDEDDAMAAISIISSFLFDGGAGAWEAWLQVSYEYARSVFRNRDPRDTLATCGDKTRFIIKAAIWFDVLAAITTQQEPRFLEYVRKLFSPEQSGVYDPTPTPELSMMSVMGCENSVVWVLAEASALGVWKRQQLARGCLSVPELVERANTFDTHLTLAASTPPAAYHAQTQTEAARGLSASIFRGATRVYLRSIVSGDFPHVREIAEAVEETMAAIRTPAIPSSVVRSTVFAFFICGALTDNTSHREEIFARLGLDDEDRASSTVGNSASIRGLLNGIWEERERGKGRPVDWRNVLHRSQMLLV